MTLLHRNKNTAENTTTTANTTDGTQQAHGGLGQKLHNMLHRGSNTTAPGLDSTSAGLQGQTYNTAPSLSTGPTPMIDSSLRSTNLPLHTQPGLSQGGFTQGGFPQTGLSQGGFSQSGFSQGGFTQGGLPQSGLSQGGFAQSGFSQGGLAQSSFPQTGLQQPGLIQSLNGQGFAGQNHLFLQSAHPAGTNAALLQQPVHPMHTAPGAFGHQSARHNAGPVTQPIQGVPHETLLVNKKLRSTITDTALIQQQQLLQQQQQFIAAPLPAFQQREIIPTETHVRPTIVQEVQRAERLVEVQPIIHREVEAPEVHVIEKHIYETVPSTGPSIINKPAIIEETVRPRIIEEVHPVVHREVPQPFIERVEQHITERIVQPTTMTKEVINDARPQFVPAGGFVAAGGAPAPILAGGNVPPAPPMPASRNLY